jgi:hypothetical protein
MLGRPSRALRPEPLSGVDAFHPRAGLGIIEGSVSVRKRGSAMEIIHAEFVPTASTPVDCLLGETGTYVLWSSRAYRRPSYIGEGNVLARMVKHVETYGSKLTGVVAVLGGTEKQRKAHGELLEATLFELAEQLQIPPTHNKAPGKMIRLFEKYVRGHNVVRFRLSGYHPLRFDTRMPGLATMEWRFEGPEHAPELFLRHPWRRS